jgi:hypothetical protein
VTATDGERNINDQTMGLTGLVMGPKNMRLPRTRAQEKFFRKIYFKWGIIKFFIIEQISGSTSSVFLIMRGNNQYDCPKI